MRDQAWLEQIFKSIRSEYFADVSGPYPLHVEWGRRARTRLGSLSYYPQRKEAIIRVTRLFTDSDIPTLVVKATIVHELCHYAHGWHSGLRPKYDHPHRGGVIQQEFRERGLEDLYLAQKKWLRDNWQQTVQKHYPNLKLKAPRRRLRRGLF